MLPIRAARVKAVNESAAVLILSVWVIFPG
jgi:hypothetical protein